MPVTFISYVIPHSYNEYTVLKFATGHIALKSSEECRPFKIFFLANCLGGAKLWKNLSFFVALPAVGLCMVNAYLKHQEEHHHTRAEFIPYEHLRIRNKVCGIGLQYISQTCLLHTLLEPISYANSFNFPFSSASSVESMHCKVGTHLLDIYLSKHVY
jgi:hypothetical protein